MRCRQPSARIASSAPSSRTGSHAPTLANAKQQAASGGRSGRSGRRRRPPAPRRAAPARAPVQGVGGQRQRAGRGRAGYAMAAGVERQERERQHRRQVGPAGQRIARPAAPPANEYGFQPGQPALAQASPREARTRGRTGSGCPGRPTMRPFSSGHSASEGEQHQPEHDRRLHARAERADVDAARRPAAMASVPGADRAPLRVASTGSRAVCRLPCERRPSGGHGSERLLADAIVVAALAG